MLIQGKWTDKSDKIKVVNPYDGTLVDTVPVGTVDDVKKAIESAEEGLIINKEMPVHRRISILKKTAEIMEPLIKDWKHQADILLNKENVTFPSSL